MAIAKTASRNVAFKVAKMRESIMEDQDELLIRKLEYGSSPPRGVSWYMNAVCMELNELFFLNFT